MSDNVNIKVKIVDYQPYVSMEQQLRDQAHEYAQRAQVYLTQGKLDRAIGCLNKAMNKIKRADLLNIAPVDHVVFGALLNKLSDQIAKQIMEG